MKGKKKLMPWEKEPWEERRREAIKKKKVIVTAKQKPKKLKMLPFREGQVIKFIDTGEWKPLMMTGKWTIETTEYKPQPKRSGVTFKQLLTNPAGGNARYGCWVAMNKMITYFPTERLDITIYHELGHMYNGDRGHTFFATAQDKFPCERKAWLTASLMIEEEDIDYFIEQAHLCLMTYSTCFMPLTRREILYYRKEKREVLHEI